MQNSLCSTVHGLALATAAIVATALAHAATAEAFVDVGAHATRVEADIVGMPHTFTDTSGLHFGAGLRRELRQGSIGARLELDDVDGDLLLAVRALDYRRHISDRWALTAFAGAARLDVATPAYGYYFGGGVELKELWPRWSLGVDVRRGDKLARDNVLPTDPQGSGDDNFYDLTGVAVYMRRRF